MKTYFFTATIVFVTDQITKYLITLNSLTLGILKLHKTQNTGAAFGILQNTNTILTIITIIAIILLIYYAKEISHSKPSSAAYGLILGGAFGNLVDRIRFGAVTDFIDVQFWPSFNIADAAITIGVMIILISDYYEKNK